MNKELLEIVLKLKDNFSPGITRMKTKSVSGLAKIRMGFQRMGAVIKKSVFNLKGLIAAFLALSALRGLIRFLKEAAEAAIIQENAVVTLNAALEASGNFSIEASEGLQAYASALQESLGIGDEVTIETLGMIEGLTKLSTKALPGAMKAVIQISNLYKVDFKSASLLLGKTLTSNLNAFSRYGIEVDLAGTALERLDQIIEGTAAGMVIAEAKMNTFEGQTTRLSNSWGDLKEAIGRNITQSPAIIALLKTINEKINLGTEAIDGWTESGDDLVGRTFVNLISKGLEVVQVLAKIAKVGLLAASSFVAIAGGILVAAKKLLEASEAIGSGIFNILGIEESAFEKAGGTVGGFLLDPLINRLDELSGTFLDHAVNVEASINSIERFQLALADAVRNAEAVSESIIPPINDIEEEMDNVADAIAGVGGSFEEMGAIAIQQLDQIMLRVERMPGSFQQFGTPIGGDIPFPIQGLIDALERQALLDEIRAAEIQTLSERFFGPGITSFDILFDLVDSQEQVRETFNQLETAVISSLQRLSESVLSGDIGAAFARTFDTVGAAIAQRVNDSIARSFQTAEGVGTLKGGILGALGGGFVGAGIGLIGSLFGRRKKRGETAADAIKVEVVNSGDVGDAILSALTKSGLIGLGAAGINNITTQLHFEAARINSA